MPGGNITFAARGSSGQNWSSDHPTGAGDWALAHLAIGDEERTLEWLNRDAEKVEANEPDVGYWSLLYVTENIFADPILDQPEFVAVRSRLGFRE